MLQKTPIIYSERCLGYGNWHVEGPQRVKKAQEFLQEKGYHFIEPAPAPEESFLAVHDAEYLFNLKKGLVEDTDTPAYAHIFEFAKLSAGGALLAAQVKGFSLMRPPGHHVGKYGAALGASTRGFCYINNVAVAVRSLNKATLILDIDGHHGNGTQEIFLGDPKVWYVSLHNHPNYPGTGMVTEGNSINFPLRGDCGEAVYLSALNHALEAVDIAKFEMVAVSAGFDTYAGDLASLGLTETTFNHIGKRIAKLGKPTFFILEGGYNGDRNGLCIDQLLRGFEGDQQAQ
ncbi:MAG TPA: histone deacetylase [Candidatus Nanoarchaeia archaeon]|nr:histone deacetylase [Candidatus Nanoarchaeia archaeon]